MTTECEHKSNEFSDFTVIECFNLVGSPSFWAKNLGSQRYIIRSSKKKRQKAFLKLKKKRTTMAMRPIHLARLG